VGANNLRADVQTQAQAISAGGHRMSPKRLKNLIQAFRWYGLADIPYLQHKVIGVRFRADLDRAHRQPVSQGVSQEIGSDLLESSQIAPNRATDADIGDDLAVRLAILELLNHGQQGGIEVLDLGQFDGDPTAQSSAGKVEYVVNEPCHAPRIAFYPGRDGLLALPDGCRMFGNRQTALRGA
jgi:hypothetical protein